MTLEGISLKSWRFGVPMGDCSPIAQVPVSNLNAHVDAKLPRRSWTRNPMNLPPEILLLIFAFTTSDYDPGEEFETPILHSGQWKSDLRMRKTLVRVSGTTDTFGPRCPFLDIAPQRSEFVHTSVGTLLFRASSKLTDTYSL